MILRTNFNAVCFNTTEVNTLLYALWQTLVTVHCLILKLEQVKAAHPEHQIKREYTVNNEL